VLPLDSCVLSELARVDADQHPLYSPSSRMRSAPGPCGGRH